MSEYTSDQWASVAEGLSRHYGWEIAQEAICRVLTAIERGTVVNDLYVYAVQTAKHLAIEEGKAKGRVGLVSLDQLVEYTDKAGLPMIEGLIDYDNPEEQLLRQEQEEDIARLKEEYFERIAASENKRMQSYWRQAYKRAVEKIA